MNSPAQLRLQLQREGLLRATPAPQDIPPWYIRVLAGVAGWISALLLLPLVGLLWFDIMVENTPVMVLSGLVCCFLGVLLQRLDGEFARQAGSAVAMAGLLAIVLQVIDQAAWVWPAVACLGLVLYITGGGDVHRFLCAGVMAVCVALTLTETVSVADAMALACLALASVATALWHVVRPLGEWSKAPVLVPMALAFTLAASVAAWGTPGLSALALLEPARAAGSMPAALGLAGLALFPVVVVPWVLWRTVKGASPARLAIPAVVVLLPFWMAAPGAGLAVCWLILAFAHGRLVLGVIGFAALLTYLARYYYQLETLLLHKALWLGAAGAVLVLLSWGMGRLGQEGGHES